MGLTITRQFVELLGGTIRVESTLGKGSTFRVELPVKQAESPVPAHEQTPEVRLVRLEPGQPEYRVLIVEDHIENWMLLQRLIELAGFKVRISNNGASGVETFQSWRPHFIWMDWRMPVMDGLAAVRRIRLLEGGRAVKIAVLSASVSQEDRDQVLAAGADDFVTKPFRFEQFYDCLEKHLGVRFVPVGASPPPAIAAVADLDHDALAALPATLRSGLAEALVSLNPRRIAEAINQVTMLNPVLGRALEHHAGRLQYTFILRVLHVCRTGKLEVEAVT